MRNYIDGGSVSNINGGECSSVTAGLPPRRDGREVCEPADGFLINGDVEVGVIVILLLSVDITVNGGDDDSAKDNETTDG